MGNKIPTFTEKQLDDYQVSWCEIFLFTNKLSIQISIFALGLYIFYAERDFEVSELA